MAAEQTAEFKAKLADEISGSANTAANALENLQRRIEQDSKELTKMNQAMRALQKETVVDVAWFKKLQGSIDSKKGSLEKGRAEYLKLGGAFETAKKKGDPMVNQIKALEAALAKAKAPERVKALQKELAEVGKPKNVGALVKAQEAVSGLGEAASNVGGPLGRMGGALSYVGGLLRTHWALVLAGVVLAAMTALTVGIIKATHALYEYGVAHANAFRAEKLHLEGLAKIRTPFTVGMGLKEMKGDELQSAITNVSQKVALGRDKIAGFGEALYKAGVRGRNFESALEGMSIKAATQGDEQAQLFKGWATYYALSGQSVDKLTDKVKARLGGIAKAQMLDANVQAEKLQESYAALFEGLKIEPLLKAKKAVYDLFSQTTETGKALKVILRDIVKPWIDLQTTALPYVKRFFQGVVIGALMVQLAFIKLKKDWVLMFGSKGAGDIDLTMKALNAGVNIIRDSGLALIALARGAMMAAKAYERLKETVGFSPLKAASAVVMPAQLTAMGKAGEAIWQGLTRGIDAGEGPVRESMAQLAKAAQDELRDGLVIRSPSQVFRDLGKAIPQGLKLGIADGTPDAQKAAGAMIPASGGMPSLGGMKGAAGNKSVSVSVGGVHVHLEGRTGDDAESIGNAVRQKLEQILQGLAIEMGGSEEPA